MRNIVIIKIPYTPTYLNGIDLGRKRAGLKELTDKKRHMKLHHNDLEGVSISVTEQQKLDNIGILTKYRPSKSREVAEKILHSNDKVDYSKEFKYQKDELDKFNKKGKFFSYFYPNRESLEERYQRERLEHIPTISSKFSSAGKFGTSSPSTTKTYEKSMNEEWKEIKMTKEICDRHKQPVTKFSYPFIEFCCND